MGLSKQKAPFLRCLFLCRKSCFKQTVAVAVPIQYAQPTELKPGFGISLGIKLHRLYPVGGDKGNKGNVMIFGHGVRNGNKVLILNRINIKRMLIVPFFCFQGRQHDAAAADKRIADPDGIIDVVCDDEGRVEFQKVDCREIKDAHICLELPTLSGSVRLIDYASAGKTWTDESRMAAWLYRKK